MTDPARAKAPEHNMSRVTARLRQGAARLQALGLQEQAPAFAALPDGTDRWQRERVADATEGTESAVLRIEKALDAFWDGVPRNVRRLFLGSAAIVTPEQAADLLPWRDNEANAYATPTAGGCPDGRSPQVGCQSTFTPGTGLTITYFPSPVPPNCQDAVACP